MENTAIPQWLDAAVQAAGVSVIYNADDWNRMVDVVRAQQITSFEAANDPSAAPH